MNGRVSEDANSPRASRPQRQVQRSGHRPLGKGGRRIRWIVCGSLVALSVVSYYRTVGAQDSADSPAAPARINIILPEAVSTNPADIPKAMPVDAVVTIRHDGCTNPARVTVSIITGPGNIPEPEGPSTSPVHVTPILVEVGTQWGIPQGVRAGALSSHSDSIVHVNLGKPPGPGFVDLLMPFPSQTFAIPIHGWSDQNTMARLNFEADWLRRRTAGTCYVVLPELTANGGLITTRYPVAPLKPRTGVVTLSDTGPHTALLSEDSVPPPTNPFVKSWLCQWKNTRPSTTEGGRPFVRTIPRPGCGGFAALSVANARESAIHRGFLWATLLGVWLGLLAGTLVDWVLTTVGDSHTTRMGSGRA